MSVPVRESKDVFVDQTKISDQHGKYLTFNRVTYFFAALAVQYCHPRSAFSADTHDIT